MVKFKSARQGYEFVNPKLDSRLQIIVLALAGFVSFFFHGKDLIITDIHRTNEEQDEIYKNNSDYKAKKWISVHQVWRGVDVRLFGFTKDEITSILKFLNDNFNYSGKHCTALAHDVSGYHLHIQVDPDGTTEIITQVEGSK